MKYQLSEELVNALVNYLARQPFNQVFQMIEALQKEIAAQQVPVQVSATDNVATLPTNEKTQKQAKS